MEDPSIAALSLSKNVLAMKFMQRSRTKVQQAAIADLQTEEKWKYDLPTTASVNNSAPVVKRLGLSSCRDFTYGRVSYQGFNEEVEKFKRQTKRQSDIQENALEASVSDETMASSLANTLNHKFSKKKRIELEEGEIEEGNEDSSFVVSEETAQRMEEIKRRVHELLGEDD